jgi:hypothetical protein
MLGLDMITPARIVCDRVDLSRAATIGSDHSPLDPQSSQLDGKRLRHCSNIIGVAFWQWVSLIVTEAF